MPGCIVFETLFMLPNSGVGLDDLPPQSDTWEQGNPTGKVKHLLVWVVYISSPRLACLRKAASSELTLRYSCLQELYPQRAVDTTVSKHKATRPTQTHQAKATRKRASKLLVSSSPLHPPPYPDHTSPAPNAYSSRPD
jgi:hypothetical protein